MQIERLEMEEGGNNAMGTMLALTAYSIKIGSFMTSLEAFN